MQSLLDRLGWSQSYLADHFGVHKNTVARWCQDEDSAGYKVAMKYLNLICKQVGL